MRSALCFPLAGADDVDLTPGASRLPLSLQGEGVGGEVDSADLPSCASRLPGTFFESIRG